MTSLAPGRPDGLADPVFMAWSLELQMPWDDELDDDDLDEESPVEPEMPPDDDQDGDPEPDEWPEDDFADDEPERMPPDDD